MRSKSVTGSLPLSILDHLMVAVKHSLNYPETFALKPWLTSWGEKKAFAEDPYNLWVYNDRSKVSDHLIQSWHYVSSPIIQDTPSTL